MACSQTYESWIEGLLLGDPPESRWPELREHARTCRDCRDHYNRVVLAERMLHGGSDAIGIPSAPELHRVEQALFIAALAEEPERWWTKVRVWIGSPRRWAPALAALVAVVVALPLLLRDTGSPEPQAPDESAGTFQPRGTPLAGEQAGFRAFCLTPESVTALDPTPSAEPPRCSRRAQLRLAVTNRGTFRRVFLVGLDAAYDSKWYAPRPPASESVAAPPSGAVDAPVGGATRLAVNHREGPLRIFALFSDAPVRMAEVEAAAAALKRQGGLVTGAETLPIERADVHQQSLLVEVGP